MSSLLKTWYIISMCKTAVCKLESNCWCKLPNKRGSHQVHWEVIITSHHLYANKFAAGHSKHFFHYQIKVVGHINGIFAEWNIKDSWNLEFMDLSSHLGPSFGGLKLVTTNLCLKYQKLKTALLGTSYTWLYTIYQVPKLSPHFQHYILIISHK